MRIRPGEQVSANAKETRNPERETRKTQLLLCDLPHRSFALRRDNLRPKSINMSYYFSRTVETDFDTAVQRTTDALKAKGFGIITQIDLQETFKKKLDKDFRPYRILGACNPNYAFEALQTEDKIGTMLPCNVIVQQVAPGQVEIAAINPVASMASVPNATLIGLAGQVEQMMREMVEAL